MKKICIFLSVLLFSVSIFAADFAIKLMPEYFIPMNSSFDSTVAGKLSLEFDPFTTIRGRDAIFIGVNGGVIPVTASGISSLFALEASGSLGYTIRVSDRFNVIPEGYGGVWIIPPSKNSIVKDTAAGLLYGARLTFNYHLTHALQLGLFGDFSIMDPLMQKASAGLSLRYSLARGLFNSSKIETEEVETDQLFPIFYSYYADHPFGNITFVNKESNDITDVEISFFLEQYMSNPSNIMTLKKVARGESFSTPITAFLNENILNTMGASEAVAQVKVSYKSLGTRIEYSKNIVLNAVSRNSMTWEDDRRAGAFVSGRDASAYTFARRVKSIVRDSLNSTTPENIQYAAAMFSALKQYGINYVVDPASAFTDNVGTASVDFLQFPFQTLLYHGGDCDDLTILNCALLEAIGIRTAMITIPGHIYMAFDSGLPVEEAAKAGDHVIQDGVVWIPLEITLTQDDFALERLIGYRQFAKYRDEAALIPLFNAWNEYKAVSMSDSDVKLEYPLSEDIIKEFKNQKF